MNFLIAYHSGPGDLAFLFQCRGFNSKTYQHIVIRYSYYSLPEWNNPLYRWGTDKPEMVTRYVDEHMIPQFKELVSTYKPSLIFSDGEWDHPATTWHSAELIAWYYNLVGDEAIL